MSLVNCKTMHMSNRFLFNPEKFLESIKSNKFVSHKARISGEFDSGKDPQPAKIVQQL